MSERKQLAEIFYYNDDDTDTCYIGELDGYFDDGFLRDYIRRFGDKGRQDLLVHLSEMITQVQTTSIQIKLESLDEINAKGGNNEKA